MRQKKEWEKTREEIKDAKTRKKFDKKMKRIVEGSKGRQHELEVVYKAETDEYIIETK